MVSPKFKELLGDTLKKAGGNVSIEDALKDKKVVALYFSAHWCPPCRGFTPKLAASYDQLVEDDGKPFEIIFVSSDKDESSFNEYYGEMPWLALPFEDRDRKASLSSKFGIRGIPSLVLLDEAGKVISKDGRSILAEDPTGKDFPWAQKTFKELIAGNLMGKDGALVPTSSLDGKTIALYFSAHWCPPCRGFTPKLAELYKELEVARAKSKDFEFVFVSSDRDESSFKEYFNEMPWLALPYEKRKEKEALSRMFEVEGIPSLVTLDADGNLINKNARGAAQSDGASAFPWAPKPHADLSKEVECNGYDVNEKPAFVVICDGANDELKGKARDALIAVATEHADKAKGSDDGPSCIFFTATSNEGPAGQVKRLTKLSERASDKPYFLILDIPDNGGFYVSEKAYDDVTADDIRGFLQSYLDKKLERKQLEK